MNRHDLLQTDLSRRRLLRLLGATTGAASLAGLAATTAAGRQTAPSGELVIAYGPDTANREPGGPSTVGMTSPHMNIFEALVLLTPDYQVVPLLAESWEAVDPSTWRFHLRQGVTFHDGTPFTAEAVKWSYDLAARGVKLSYVFLDENSTTIVDDFTVDITTTQPNARMVASITHPWAFGIQAPGADSAERRIGTGPFREVEYVPDDHFTVEAFDGYWGDPAKVSRVTVRYLPDPTTRALALQSGEVNLVYDLPREAVAEIEGSDDRYVVASEVGASVYMLVNLHTDAPYDLGQDPAVREAVAAAIDREALVEDVWLGQGEPGLTIVPPASLGSYVDRVTGVPFDPEHARQVLEGAGWVAGSGGVREKDGRPLALKMVVSRYEDMKPLPEFIQAQLGDVGIEVEIVQTPDYVGLLERGEGDLWIEQGNVNDGNVCAFPDNIINGNPPGRDPWSIFNAGPEAQELMQQCFAAAETEQVQETAANGLHLAIDEIHSLIPLVGTPRLYGLSNGVQGFVAHPSQINQRWDEIVVAGS